MTRLAAPPTGLRAALGEARDGPFAAPLATREMGFVDLAEAGGFAPPAPFGDVRLGEATRETGLAAPLGLEGLRPAFDTARAGVPFVAAPLVRREVGLLDFVPLPAVGALTAEGLRPVLDAAFD